MNSWFLGTDTKSIESLVKNGFEAVANQTVRYSGDGYQTGILKTSVNGNSIFVTFKKEYTGNNISQVNVKTFKGCDVILADLYYPELNKLELKNVFLMNSNSRMKKYMQKLF